MRTAGFIVIGFRFGPIKPEKERLGGPREEECTDQATEKQHIDKLFESGDRRWGWGLPWEGVGGQKEKVTPYLESQGVHQTVHCNSSGSVNHFRCTFTPIHIRASLKVS